MPAIFESDPIKERLNITRTGLFGIDDLLDSVMRMRSLGIWNYSVLVDAREATTDLTPASAQQLVSRIVGLGNGADRGPIAVVAGNEVTFGMVRMFTGLATPLGMRVRAFRKVEEAERWLDQFSDVDSR